jgi:hypothetical protein
MSKVFCALFVKAKAEKPFNLPFRSIRGLGRANEPIQASPSIPPPAKGKENLAQLSSSAKTNNPQQRKNP